MKELELNILALLFVAVPQLLVRIVNHYCSYNNREQKLRWTDVQVETVKAVVFLLSLVLLLLYVLPFLGLSPAFDPR